VTVTEYVVALLAVGVGALAQGAVGFGMLAAPVLDRGWTRPAVLAMSTAAALVLVFDAFIG